MGWWSATIMGGDTPLDLEAKIYAMLGIEMYTKKTDKKRKIPKAKFEKEQNRVVKEILNLEEGWDSTTVGMQVLGTMMMEVGAKMSDNNKKLILNGAKNDEWAKTSSERKEYIKAFISTVKSYNNKPTIIDYESLGEVFSKHSGSGLINKNVKKPA